VLYFPFSEATPYSLSARFHLPPQAAPGRDQPLIFTNVNALPQTEAAKNLRCAHRSGIGV
jgi:hypothetical protein